MGSVPTKGGRDAEFRALADQRRVRHGAMLFAGDGRGADSGSWALWERVRGGWELVLPQDGCLYLLDVLGLEG